MRTKATTLWLVAVIAVLVETVTPAAEAPVAPAAGAGGGHDRTFWRGIVTSEYRVPEGTTAAALIQELSPLLGIDPANMYKAIRTVGPEHCTLSSDAGEPLFPNSVESLRLLRGHMTAFGCTAEEIYTMCTTNPSFIVGLTLTTTQRASAA